MYIKSYFIHAVMTLNIRCIKYYDLRKIEITHTL